MSKPVKWIGILVILVVALVALLPLIASSGFVRGKIEAAANQTLASELSIGALKVGYGGDLAITKFSITNPPGFPSERPFVAFESSTGGISLFPLLGGKIEMKEWRLDKPEVTLIRNAAGEFNFARLLKGSGTGAPAPAPGGKSPEEGGKKSPEPAPPSGPPPELPPISARLIVADGNLVYVDEKLGTRSVIPHFGMNGSLDVADGVPSFATKVEIEDARSEQGFLPLLRMFVPMLAGPSVEAVKLSGGLDFKAELRATGADAASLRRSLTGQGELRLENGAIEGAQGLADLLAKAGVAQKGLSFDLLTVQFRFQDGRVYNDDIQIDGKELDLGLKGWTSFDGEMDYAFDGAPLIALLPKAVREEIAKALGPDPKIPGSIRGSVSAPNVGLEMPGLTDAAMKAATDRVEKELGDVLKKEGIDVEKIKSGDVDLGGLFGGKKRAKKDEEPKKKDDEEPKKE